MAGPADNLADGTRMALEQLASGRVAEHLEAMTKVPEVPVTKDPATSTDARRAAINTDSTDSTAGAQEQVR